MPRRAGVGLVGAGPWGGCTPWRTWPRTTPPRLPVRVRMVAEASAPAGREAADRLGFERRTADWTLVVSDPEVSVMSVAGAAGDGVPRRILRAVELEDVVCVPRGLCPWGQSPGDRALGLARQKPGSPSFNSVGRRATRGRRACPVGRGESCRKASTT